MAGLLVCRIQHLVLLLCVVVCCGPLPLVHANPGGATMEMALEGHCGCATCTQAVWQTPVNNTANTTCGDLIRQEQLRL
jgi:hypothetical protein